MFETTRPIIGAVPPPEIYLCWAKRSLLRQGLAPGPVNGADTPAYRAAVRSFRARSEAAPPATVDAATQDRLVRLNHADAAYARWVQDALVRARLLAPAAREARIDKPGSAARRAIATLQKLHGLAEDGWVGPKTERLLRGLIPTAPPDPRGRPLPCLPSRVRPPGSDTLPLAERLQLVDTRALSGHPAARERLACLQAFLLAALRGAPHDDRYASFSLLDTLGRERSCGWQGVPLGAVRQKRAQRALANFRRCAEAATSVPATAACLLQVHDAILCHLNALFGALLHLAGDARVENSPECAWLLEIAAASRRGSPKSVYACYAKLIAAAARPCAA
jgi:hypothetical protein